MASLRRLILRLWTFLRPAAAERELSREMSAHLAAIEDDLLRQGLEQTRAQMTARRAFGGVEQAKERQRDARSFPWMEDVKRDVRYAARALSRQPGFLAIVVLIVGLGVGANVAIFSIVRTVLLRPLPFERPEQLARIYEEVPASASPNGRAMRLGGLDLREFVALRDSTSLLSHVTQLGLGLVSVAGSSDTVQRELTSVSAAAFPMLGVRAALGRSFTPDDERSGNDKVIVLSDGAWRRYFGGDPQAIGRTLRFNGNTFTQGVDVSAEYTVIGIMPAGFHFPDDNTDFWVPAVAALPADGRPRRRQMMARLAEGVSLEAAAAEASASVQELRGRVAGERSPAAAPRFEFVRVRDEIAAPFRPALLVLIVAVACVLLVACANVMNLLLARTAARERELALRMAIGAGRSRLMRQLLTESVLLSLLGGVAGIALAAVSIGLFRRLATDMGRFDLGALGSAFPRLDAIAINSPVIGFAAAASIGAGLLFGLLPAFRQTRRGPIDALRGATGSTVTGAHLDGRMNVQSVLIVTEIAMATALVIGAGLLTRSFVNLTGVAMGYDPEHVLTFQVSLPGARGSAVEIRRFAADMTARLEAIPGVRAAAYANQLPLVALENSLSLRTAAEPPPQGPVPDAPDVRLVSRDYFKTMGIRVLSGRPFEEGDGAGQPPVLLINRTLARRMFGDVNPSGTQVYLGPDTTAWTIIGVVDDVRQRSLDAAPRPQIFIDLRQWSSPRVPIFPLGPYYAVRTMADPLGAIGHVRQIVAQFDPRASIENVATMDQIVANRTRRPRMYAVLLGLFAGVAAAIAAAGIYGITSHAVTRRTREIGIRRALGASTADVIKRILGKSTLLTAAGVGIGTLGAAALTRYLESLLFGVTPFDPATFVGVGLVFSLVATAAALVPTLRAIRVDPMRALRRE